MNEPLGIAIELAERRNALAARMSPSARAQAFPTQYAKPMPVERKEEKLLKMLRVAQGKLDEARAEATRLKAANDELRQVIADMEMQGQRVMTPRTPTVNNVMRQFVSEYNALATIEDRALLDLVDLFSPRRNRFVAWARQVCMSLCRDLCKGASLPMIGRAFGGKDHTTVMHACRVAPERMISRPDLAAVADRVRAHFAPALAEAA